MYNDMNESNVFKALADENRLEIVKMLSGGELCACRILENLDLTQSTLSHHMKILCDSKLVTSRKEGKWTHYSLSKTQLGYVNNFITDLIEGNLLNFKDFSPVKSDKIQLFLLTGFLGSGKTTIMHKIINNLKGSKVSIIQNEFGKLGIDGEILQNNDIDMIEINRGSIFCSCLQMAFVEALAKMSEKNVDYLFVESSGLSDPSNIEEILEATKVLVGDRYDFRGAICLVDGVNFEEYINDIETVNRQLKHCHIAIVTKIDLIDIEKLSEIKSKIKEINPNCPILVSSNGDVNLDFLNKNLMEFKWAKCEETTNTVDNKPKTISLNYSGQVKKENIDDFLNGVKENTFRIKGFVNIENIGWNQVDVVGSRIDYKPCEAKNESNIVFISKIGPQIIRVVSEKWNENISLPMKLNN